MVDSTVVCGNGGQPTNEAAGWDLRIGNHQKEPKESRRADELDPGADVGRQ